MTHDADERLDLTSTMAMPILAHSSETLSPRWRRPDLSHDADIRDKNPYRQCLALSAWKAGCVCLASWASAWECDIVGRLRGELGVCLTDEVSARVAGCLSGGWGVFLVSRTSGWGGVSLISTPFIFGTAGHSPEPPEQVLT